MKKCDAKSLSGRFFLLFFFTFLFWKRIGSFFITMGVAFLVHFPEMTELTKKRWLTTSNKAVRSFYYSATSFRIFHHFSMFALLSFRPGGHHMVGSWPSNQSPPLLGLTFSHWEVLAPCAQWPTWHFALKAPQCHFLAPLWSVATAWLATGQLEIKLTAQLTLLRSHIWFT